MRAQAAALLALLALAVPALAGRSARKPKLKPADERGLELFYSGHEDGALKTLEQAVASDPSDAKARRALHAVVEVRRREESRRRYVEGLRAYYSGDAGRARQALLLAIELDSRNTLARAALDRLSAPAGSRP